MLFNDGPQRPSSERPVEDHTLIALSIGNLPGLANGHVRWQRLAVERLERAPAPDALLEARLECEGI
jgi:hypothetical protein